MLNHCLNDKHVDDPFLFVQKTSFRHGSFCLGRTQTAHLPHLKTLIKSYIFYQGLL